MTNSTHGINSVSDTTKQLNHVSAKMSPRIDQLTYDAEADAAYLRLVKTSREERLTTAVLEGKPIHLDFNQDDQLVGIEVLSASTYLPERLLDQAEKLDENTDKK